MENKIQRILNKLTRLLNARENCKKFGNRCGLIGRNLSFGGLGLILLSISAELLNLQPLYIVLQSLGWTTYATAFGLVFYGRIYNKKDLYKKREAAITQKIEKEYDKIEAINPCFDRESFKSMIDFIKEIGDNLEGMTYDAEQDENTLDPKAKLSRLQQEAKEKGVENILREQALAAIKKDVENLIVKKYRLSSKQSDIKTPVNTIRESIDLQDDCTL